MPSWRLHLRSEGKSQRTIQWYLEAAPLFAACSPSTGCRPPSEKFVARIIEAFYTTPGCRLAEITQLRLAHDDELRDVGLDGRKIRVVGKGRRWRVVPIGNKTAKTLDRYLRIRARHPFGLEPWLWLGKKGRKHESGIAQMRERRGRRVRFVTAR